MKPGFLFALCLCFCIIATIGCGNGRQQLKGKVTFEDGSPVPCGTICFLQGNHESRGTIQSDGSYVVGTLSTNDGIPPGEYQVYVTNVVEERGMDSSGMPIVVSIIDEKYTSPTKSGITYKTGKSPFDVKVERAKR